MAKKTHKWLKRIFLTIGVLVILGMALNWFMTYRLEEMLRTRLRAEIVKATDGFYDFSFDRISVGLFDGELMIKGLTLFPDSATVDERRANLALPEVYVDVHIDTISFKGINLAWRINYRELSFKEFSLSHPSIKITAPDKSVVYKQEHDRPQIEYKDLYALVSPYFDLIGVKYIKFKDADVEYVVEGDEAANYKLKDFEFAAYQFALDKYSLDRGELLFSKYFDFRASTPQTIFESKYFLLNLDQIGLSTMDSTVFVTGADLKSKDEYWEQRLEVPGSYSRMKVDRVKLSGISFKREDGFNFLYSKKFEIRTPEIEYYSVAKEDKPKPEDSSKYDLSEITSWSLYSLTSPILERISIDNISIKDAHFLYGNSKNKQTDFYTLNKLNFEAYGFIVDSSNKGYKIVDYIDDFSLEASDFEGYLTTSNSSFSADKFKLSTLDKKLVISKTSFSPISKDNSKDYFYGQLDSLSITGIDYSDGLDAELISINKPRFNYTKVKHIVGTKNEADADERRDIVNNILDAVAPFVSYVSVNDVVINDASASFLDKKDNHKYSVSSLYFSVSNFHIDNNTRDLQDYFFGWDRYDIRFKNFDNTTPDLQYRIQIAKADFNSVSKNILLEGLKVSPGENNKGSYINIETPYALLLGWDEKAVKNKILSFKNFIIESPAIEIVKKASSRVAQKKEDENHALSALELIAFDTLSMPLLSFYLFDELAGKSIQMQARNLQVGLLRWDLDEGLSVDNMLLDSPDISYLSTKENPESGHDEAQQQGISSLGDITLKQLNINNALVKLKTLQQQVDFSSPSFSLSDFYWSQKGRSTFRIADLDLHSPLLKIDAVGKAEKRESTKIPAREDIKKQLLALANEIQLGRINVSRLNVNLNHSNKLINTDFLIEDLYINQKENNWRVDELAFVTKDINIPIDDGFYTFTISNIDFSKRKGELHVDKVGLAANYPKFDFAYKHPTGADWFNVGIDRIRLSGIDADKLLSDTILLAKKMRVDNVLLENLKNQKIVTEPKLVPLLYELFQRFPLRYAVDELDIRDFSVIYEELAKGGYQTARIPFTQMNGQVRNFTNIQRGGNDFYTLHADGLAMSAAPFVAEWKIPVDSVNDKFYLTAEIKDLDLTAFNQMVHPMAPAYVGSGRIESLWFATEANSLGATVDMRLVYDSLYVVVNKDMFSDRRHPLLTKLVNRWGIKESNLGSGIRTPSDTIVRDPYHSNFNYFWQILQPPLMESVGISKKKQNMLHNITAFINRFKKRYEKKEKDKK